MQLIRDMGLYPVLERFRRDVHQTFPRSFDVSEGKWADVKYYFRADPGHYLPDAGAQSPRRWRTDAQRDDSGVVPKVKELAIATAPELPALREIERLLPVGIIDWDADIARHVVDRIDMPTLAGAQIGSAVYSSRITNKRAARFDRASDLLAIG